MKVNTKWWEYVPSSKRRNLAPLCPKGRGRLGEIDDEIFMREVETQKLFRMCTFLLFCSSVSMLLGYSDAASHITFAVCPDPYGLTDVD